MCLRFHLWDVTSRHCYTVPDVARQCAVETSDTDDPVSRRLIPEKRKPQEPRLFNYDENLTVETEKVFDMQFSVCRS
jgi:hypothetical protein